MQGLMGGQDRVKQSSWWKAFQVGRAEPVNHMRSWTEGRGRDPGETGAKREGRVGSRGSFPFLKSSGAPN